MPATGLHHERPPGISEWRHRDHITERRRPRRHNAVDSLGDRVSRSATSTPIPAEMATSKPLKIVRDAKDFLQARANARPNAKLTIRTSATPSPTGPPFEDAEEGLVRRRLPSLLQNLRQAESAPPTRGVPMADCCLQFECHHHQEQILPGAANIRANPFRLYRM